MPPPDLPVQHEPLPYELRLEARPRAQVDLVVIHCTELPDLATAREYGERVLYTGDIFRIDGDGYLYFVGRRDDVIKSRGEKVSPKEIEAVIHGCVGEPRKNRRSSPNSSS